MSASKKDELLKNLTRRDAQKPPMDVTYENKGLVLEQMTERPGEQNTTDAQQQDVVLTQEQTSATAETQISKDANVQNSKYADLRRITFHIPEDLFKQLKLISVEEDLTMLEIGAQMAREYVERKNRR